MERACSQRFSRHSDTLDMFPSFSKHDAVDGHHGNTVDSRQRVLRNARAATDLKHLFCRQLVGFACLTASLTTFGAHILNVIQWCPKEQVIRSDTGGIITVMQNLKPIRDWSVVDQPACPRCYNFTISTSFTDGAIAPPIALAGPNPALVGPFNITPESNFKCIRESFGQGRMLNEARTCSLHTTTGNSAVEQIIPTNCRRVSAVALTDVVTITGTHAIIGDNFKLSKTLANKGDFSRHSIGSFNVVFSGGRPATTGAHCAYLRKSALEMQL